MKEVSIHNTSVLHQEHREFEKTEFLREQTECPVCQGYLDVFVEALGTGHIREEARCTECMALARVQDHHLH